MGSATSTYKVLGGRHTVVAGLQVQNPTPETRNPYAEP